MSLKLGKFMVLVYRLEFPWIGNLFVFCDLALVA